MFIDTSAFAAQLHQVRSIWRLDTLCCPQDELGFAKQRQLLNTQACPGQLNCKHYRADEKEFIYFQTNLHYTRQLGYGLTCGYEEIFEKLSFHLKFGGSKST